MLSDRRQRVLAALIEEYVAQAMPVGSRTLTERYGLGVSPATVRNELSFLEDEGYISQPHTSAGRVPTDRGYRAFVDNLIATGAIDDRTEDLQLIEALRGRASELDRLIDEATDALVRLTDCLSVVVPLAHYASVRQVTLVSLGARTAVVVVVTRDGQVHNGQVEFAEDVSGTQLADIQRALNELVSTRSVVGGRSLADLSAPALTGPAARAVLDEVARCLDEHDAARTRRIGMTALARKPEFSSSSSLIPLMQALEDDAVLLQIIDPQASSHGPVPTVRIGSENPTAHLSGVSVVASRYGRGDTGGVVAVIGPTRMDYSRVLRAVRIASSALEDD
ncbi:heat-inducible transcription repressor HrcA [Eggerthellaceae bacterium zg-1084]|uniref:Heat-inducible transcription repressor HrcA n=1 Tax=Berryella wangjianweii TaxID=2734634 RepID=A0A6M8J0B2_9ACTN|nr:heat-inducible transcriptional repressor HrcA [Berryella wangjianweii]NPD30314.1 heat-inducible transcription repressor HrcA [Berryella wangjianweii]QKF06997.1 heat-inducible transcription repressor HrcA [Berryella wangjianweii]